MRLTRFVYPQPFKRPAHAAAVAEMCGVLPVRFEQDSDTGRYFLYLETSKPDAVARWLGYQFEGVRWRRESVSADLASDR